MVFLLCSQPKKQKFRRAVHIKNARFQSDAPERMFGEISGRLEYPITEKSG
jgi:hypothetical protein